MDVLNVIAAHFEGDDDAEFIGDAIANIAAIAGSIVPEPTLIEKTITANDTYNASDDNADGYSKVTVNVPVPVSDMNAKLSMGGQTLAECLIKFDIPEGTTTIPANYFEDSTLEAVTIPDTVTLIEGYAFSGNSDLLNIVIPSSVKDIYDNAFADCGNEEDGFSIVLNEGLETIGSHVFLNSYLETLIVPSTLTSLGEEMFDNSELTEITFAPGSQLTAIGDNAFRGAYKLTSIDVPSNVTEIGDSAFYGCEALTDITIPSGVTTIATNAFFGCEALETITINKAEGSISGAPWSAPETTQVIWTG